MPLHADRPGDESWPPLNDASAGFSGAREGVERATLFPIARADPRTQGRQARVPRPFLKWAGGKGQILGELTATVSDLSSFGAYHEPFVGGGALYFELFRTGRLPGRACLSDVNRNLTDCYETVKGDVEQLIRLLKTHAQQHSFSHFYQVRAAVPESKIERAARVIYLNKTCFNGLYRENSKGQFNVPLGNYKNPTVCDEPNLRACSAALTNTEIRAEPFEEVLNRAGAGDLVYFDPPYVPVSATSSFTGYAKDGFGPRDQERLASVFAELDRRQVHVVLSNSKAPVVEDLYKKYRIRVVFAKRAVNSRGDKRGDVEEVIVTNF